MRSPLAAERPKIIELFSGVGGFSLGAHLAGFETILAIDQDTDLTSSYAINFPNTKLISEDLSVLGPREILSLAKKKPGEIAGVIGGPPCQGFSSIGLQDPNDPRNALVVRFFESVRYAMPDFFIMENVPNILRPRFRALLETGIQLVDSLYDLVGPFILDAARYGAATTRKRVFVLGIRKDLNLSLVEEDIRNLESTRTFTVRDAIQDIPDPRLLDKVGDGMVWANYNPVIELGEYARSARSVPPYGLSVPEIRKQVQQQMVSGLQATIHTPAVLKRLHNLKPGESDPISRCRRLKWDQLCNTLRAGTGREHGSYQSIRPIHPESNRVITVREAARIQGFPDWFQFHRTKWHSFRMIGNSVSPKLSEQLFRMFFDKLAYSQVTNLVSDSK